MTKPTALQQLATTAVQSLPEMPALALHAARRCLVDWFGVALAGHGEPPVRLLRRALGGASESHADDMLGAPALAAYADAWVMGAAGHVLDYDDTDYRNLVHVSATLLPALVAVARRCSVPGDQLLRAIVCGYEVEAALGRRLGRPLTARGWHVSGVIGHFGAALAAAVARGLGAAEAAQAMGIAATGSSGLIAAFGSMSKALQLGRTGAGGVLAAELAAEGFTGALGALDASPGFAETYTGAAVDDWADAAQAWGRPYAITENNAFKPHAACMITHPAIDAALQLRARLAEAGLGLDAVEAIRCRVNPLAPKVAGHLLPTSGLQGKFSVAYCVVAGLVDGHALPAAFSDAAVLRPDVRRLLQRLAVATDPGIGEQQAEVALQLVDGRSWRVHVPMARGNPANPMTDAELGDKFLSLAGDRLRDAPAVLDGLWHFEQHTDAGAWLRAALQPAEKTP